jgi:hypothetical protein
MNNPIDVTAILLSGTIGVLIGAAITSIVTIYIFRKQMRIQSNRFFLEKLMLELQNIYIAYLSHMQIKDQNINVINALQDVSYKDMAVLDNDLNILKQAILDYNIGRLKTLESTSTSQEEIHASKMIRNSIKAIMETIRKLT